MSSAVPNVSNSAVASDTVVTSERDNLLEVNVLEEDDVTHRLVFKQPVSIQFAILELYITNNNGNVIIMVSK